jgi:hypothetical protein
VGDEVVAFVDGLERRLHVRGAQPVEADVADDGDQVAVDVGVVAADGAGAQPLTPGQPQGEPLPGGDGGVQDLAGADLAPHFVRLGQALVLLEGGGDEVDDAVAVVGVVLAEVSPAADGVAAGAVRRGGSSQFRAFLAQQPPLRGATSAGLAGGSGSQGWSHSLSVRSCGQSRPSRVRSPAVGTT